MYWVNLGRLTQGSKNRHAIGIIALEKWRN